MPKPLNLLFHANSGYFRKKKNLMNRYWDNYWNNFHINGIINVTYYTSFEKHKPDQRTGTLTNN